MMKIKQFTSTFLFTSILFFCACKKNEEQQNISQETAKLNFSISANNSLAPTFKTGHTDSEGKIIVTWEKGDEIGLFTLVSGDDKNTNVPLQITKTEDISNAGKTAIFSGEIAQNSNWTMDLYAYYPHQDGSINLKKIPVSVIDQTVNGKQSKHLAINDVLVADPIKGFKTGQTNVSLNFKHVMAIADFKISLPVATEPIEIREIKIMRQNGKRIQTSGTLDITAETESDRVKITSTEAQSNYAQITKVENVTLTSGESFNAKVALLPTDWTGENISIYVTTSIGTYLVNKPGMKFETGKRYNSELVLDNLIPVNLGDYYYADGTWSTNLNPDKKTVGIVVYKGHKGVSANGYVASIVTTATFRGKGNYTNYNFDVPEIPNTPRATIDITPANYYISQTPFIEPSTSFIGIEDWNGKRYAEMIKTKRNLEFYSQMHFLLNGVDFSISGVTDGPAAKGNWFTPSWSQMHMLSLDYEFFQQKFESAGGNRTPNSAYLFTSSEPDFTSGNVYYAHQTVWSFVYGEIQTVGNFKFRFTAVRNATQAIRPYLEF